MDNITYLFGAGASFNALPVVDQMPRRMAKLIEYLKFEMNGTNSNEKISLSPNDDILEFASDLDWLTKFAAKHASVDTFAKKLTLTNKEDELFMLKNVLSAFLLIEQFKNSVDDRYDSFFASLLESKFKMPKNIKIISWNYDMQLEMAFQVYSGDSTIYEAQRTLGIYSKYADNYFAKQSSENFAVFKINGSSMLYSNNYAKNLYTYCDSKHKQSTEAIFQICKNYCNFKKQQSNYIHGLSFAWEREYQSNQDDIISIAKTHVNQSNILVVIGYSFPFFNREIDRLLFDFRGMPNLNKVYFQAPNASEIIEKFHSIREDISEENLISKNGCEQFYLPNEL